MMFEKFLNDYAKSIKHVNEKMSPIEQLSVLLREGIDYVWMNGDKVTVSKNDAKLILSYYNAANGRKKDVIAEAISTEAGFRRFVATRRREMQEAKEVKQRKLDESVSEMFDLIRNLKYVPGLEKVVSVNSTVDGMEATVQAISGAQYHISVTPIQQVNENFHDRSWYKSYDAWDRARQALPTDDDGRFVSYYEGKIMAKWSEADDEGWVQNAASLEGGEREYVKREAFKVQKGQSIEETGPEGSLDDFLDPFKRRATNTGTPPSKEALIKYHKDQIAKLGPNAYKSHIAYHERELRKLQSSVKEDLSLARDGDGNKKIAIDAMRKAAVTMVAAGIGRNEERARLQLQTIGLNYGLKPQEAAELAQKILAKEIRLRREYNRS